MEHLKPKVPIIGCGNVGMRFAYALMIRGIARQITIVDLDRDRLEGEVMDLSHGEPYTSPVAVVAGDYPDIEGSDLVVITAGRKQKPGQSRLDLAKDNVEVFRAMIPQIMAHAPDAIMLVVTNPVDVLAYAAYKISGKPPNAVMSSGTVLDTARFRFLLSRHCNVDPHNIHAYFLGEHGDSEFAVWSKAMIGGVLFTEYCAVCPSGKFCDRKDHFRQIYDEVRKSAYAIIEKKGETSYGIGLALVRIAQAIINDENAILPVSSLVNGYLNERDVFLSLPAIVNKNGIRNILALDLDKGEQGAFKNSAAAVRKVIKDCGF
ncbi:MAG: L-lactate dehydrogenase [Candidatus Omnitrophica bacterium]|nr:L-lactate dehydrogenase [Candidatus Omnitrophota bacterium]